MLNLDFKGYRYLSISTDSKRKPRALDRFSVNSLLLAYRNSRAWLWAA
jgi:hypothetical protein